MEMQFLAQLDDGTPRHTGNMCSPGTEIEYNGGDYPDTASIHHRKVIRERSGFMPN
ncbi:MAG: hypothetical protein WDO15_28385 [Bacteroidota bacterium]